MAFFFFYVSIEPAVHLSDKLCFYSECEDKEQKCSGMITTIMGLVELRGILMSKELHYFVCTECIMKTK